MTKHLISIRISEATQDKLDYLTERHGTQTEAVAVAVDQLHRAERSKEAEMNTPWSWLPEEMQRKHNEKQAQRDEARRDHDLIMLGYWKGLLDHATFPVKVGPEPDMVVTYADAEDKVRKLQERTGKEDDA